VGPRFGGPDFSPWCHPVAPTLRFTLEIVRPHVVHVSEWRGSDSRDAKGPLTVVDSGGPEVVLHILDGQLLVAYGPLLLFRACYRCGSMARDIE
jgi:hypothetical protein